MATSDPRDEKLTMMDIAVELHVSTRQVQRWIAAGKLEAIRLGHSTVRIRRAAFDEFLRVHRTGV